MNDMITDLITHAKKIIAKDGFLNPIAFVIKNKTVVSLDVCFDDNLKKKSAYKAVGFVAKKTESDFIILLNDVASSTETHQFLTTVINIKGEKISGYLCHYHNNTCGYHFYSAPKISSLKGGIINNICDGLNLK